MRVTIQREVSRRETRWRVRQDVAIDIPDAGMPRDLVGTVRNLSENGLLVESTEQLTVGSTISFTLVDVGKASAEVVWQQGYLHGCRFHVPLPKSAVNVAVLRSPIGNDPLDIKKPGHRETGELTKWEATTSLSVPTVASLVLLVTVAIIIIVLR